MTRPVEELPLDACPSSDIGRVGRQSMAVNVVRSETYFLELSKEYHMHEFKFNCKKVDYYQISRVAKKMQNFQRNDYMAIPRLSDPP